MNENIGAKGGRKDRKRTLIITYENKKKLKEYNNELKKIRLQKLEKEVRRQQIFTFFKATPIILAGQTLHLISAAVKNDKKDLNKNSKKTDDYKTKSTQVLQIKKQEPLKEKETNILENIIIHKAVPVRLIEDEKKKKITQDLEEDTINKDILPKTNVNIDSKLSNIEIKKEPLFQTNIENNKKQIEIKQDNNKGISNQLHSKIGVPKVKRTGIDIKAENIENIESHKNTDQLQSLENKEILNKYERKLKDIRSDLKKLEFEYFLIQEEVNDLYRKKEAEELLNKLNIIIKKIEELKEKIKIDNLDSYDEKYIESLVNEYILEFNDKKVVKEIKDSDLYILIAEKLNELDSEKDRLSLKVTTRKEQLAVDEEKLKDLTEKYYNFKNINETLLEMQYEQEYILRNLEEKVKNSTSEIEKVTYEVKVMNKESNKLLKKMALFSMLQGARSSKVMATMTAYFLYLMKKVEKPKLERKTYKKIKVEDYSLDIESSISKIESTVNLLNTTTTTLKKTIKTFKKDYEEYFDILPECGALLSNLNKVLDSLQEKEYELNKIKEQQKKLLDKNNQKVKKIRATN